MNRHAYVELQQAGFVLSAGGNVLLAGSAEKLFSGWLRFLRVLLEPFYSKTFSCPLFIEEATLQDAGYLDHFPQQVFIGASYKDSMSPNQFVTPAACLHLYPLLRERYLDDELFTALVTARCARFENGRWQYPYRMASFQMTELVAVGSQATIDDLCHQMQHLLDSTFNRLGLGGNFETATDAFFLGNDAGAQVIQKLKGLKQEYRVVCGSEQIALASINNHETFFGHRFHIHQATDTPATSCCIAFGLERLTAYGLLLWGENEKNWPKEIKR